MEEIKAVVSKKSKGIGFLDWIERVGNSIPNPFWLFLYILAGLYVISNIVAWFGVSVVHPSSGKTLQALPLISGEGLRILTRDFVNNFRNFKPLGDILIMMMGVGLAEGSGLLGALMRNTIMKVSKKYFIPAAVAGAIFGHVAGDPAIVLLPPLYATIFYTMGMHPLVGVTLGYGVTCASWAANFFISATNDVVLLGASEAAARTIASGISVPVVANWYFNVAAAVCTVFAASFVTLKYVEPRLRNLPFVASELDSIGAGELGPLEKRGLRNAGWALLAYVAFILAMLLPEGAPLRNQETGGLIPSPFFSGLVAILMLAFWISGFAYGRTVGTIKTSGDVPKHMGKAVGSMVPFVLMCAVVSQFLAAFNYSNLPPILAVKGGELLERFGFTGAPMWVTFILFVTFINLFIGSSNTKWFAFAPIFVPMMMTLGYHPAVTTMAYRVGDSVTNGISPLFNYFPILLGYIKRYTGKDNDVGSIMAALIPYSIGNAIVWIILFLVWIYVGIPFGPGGPVHYVP